MSPRRRTSNSVRSATGQRLQSRQRHHNNARASLNRSRQTAEAERSDNQNDTGNITPLENVEVAGAGRSMPVSNGRESSQERNLNVRNTFGQNSERSDGVVDNLPVVRTIRNNGSTELQRTINSGTLDRIVEDEGRENHRDEINLRRMKLIDAYTKGNTRRKNENTMRTLAKAVRKTIIPKMKFVQSGKLFGSFEHPDFTDRNCWVNNLFESIPQLSEASDTVKAEIWMTYRKGIKEQFSLHRSGVTLKIKRNFFRVLGEVMKRRNALVFGENDPLGKLIARLKEGTIDKLREDGTNEEFRICAELGFSPMVSKQKWKSNRTIVDLSAFLTIADEAFAFLCMENNIKEWIDLITKGDEAQKKGTLTRYTGIQVNKDGTKKGWSLEGKKRFNALYDEIKKQRGTEKSIEKEDWVKNVWVDQQGDNETNHNAQGANTNEEEEEARRVREEERFIPRNGFGA